MHAPLLFASIFDDGVHWDALDDVYPTSGGTYREQLTLPADNTHFGFVADGVTTIGCDAGTFTLRAGMYFCVPGAATLDGGHGVVATRENTVGLFSIGGPVEDTGRLTYIDGCTDTLLISPPVLGDACLNLLALPPQTRQRMHDHPSVRIGVVASGNGRCITPDFERALAPGTAFAIPPGARHCFHTDDEAMRVIAFHPDTDFGPQDHDHPMVNRTVHLEVTSSMPNRLPTSSPQHPPVASSLDGLESPR